MDENTENTEGVRVTRARTRRLSVLDTDSRPGTPLLDTASDRGTASPRPTRRTRLNSATELLRTPTRTTRASVVRGETPEPTTPASVKRSARTPAKSTRGVRQQQQQPLKEETVEELEPDNNDKLRSNHSSPATAQGSPTDERRVTRSMSQTPPAAYRSANNTPVPVWEQQLQPDAASLSVEEQTANKNKQLSSSRSKLAVRVENLSVIDKDISVMAETLQKSLESVAAERPSMEVAVKQETNSSSPHKMEAQVESLAVEMSKAEDKQMAEKNEAQVESLAVEMSNAEDKQMAEKMEAEAKTKTPTKSPERRETIDLLEKVDKDIDVIKIPADLLESGDGDQEKETEAEDDVEQKNIKNAASKSITEDEVFESPASPDPEPQPLSISTSALKQLAMEDEQREEVQSPDLETMEKNNNLDFKDMAMEVDEDPEIPFKDTEPIDLPNKSLGSASAVISDEDQDEGQEEKLLESRHPSTGMKVIDNVRLSDLTPGIKARLVTTASVDSKKSVCFENGAEAAEDDKVKFPKTPSRCKNPSAFSLEKSLMLAKAGTQPMKPMTDTLLMAADTSLKEHTPLKADTPLKSDTPLKAETPLKAASLKARNSSTPITKDDREASITMLKPAPARIDCLKSWDQVEAERREEELKAEAKAKPEPKPQPAKNVSGVLRLNSDDEDEVDDEYKFLSEFVDNEVEVAPDDYNSGDSMESSERREIADNEIIEEGESVGSQDTDVSFEDESIGNDSFIVSDTSDVVELRYSSNELEDGEDDEYREEISPRGKKPRSRIIIMDSTDEDEQQKHETEKEKTEKQEPKEAEEKLRETPKNRSDCSSNASKLSEAAQILIGSQEHYSTSETELENSRKLFLNEINKSECFNKTAPRLDMTAMEVNSTDDEQSGNEEDPKAVTGNKSVYEVLDSDEDDGEDADEEENETVSSSHNKSSSFVRQNKQKANDEEALLAELASGDLTHLKTMFNPLQKSRRQSLYMPSPEMAAKEPKLQRRSERGTVNDFCPSQSFVEMVAERKSHQGKRKRLSKSFSGAAEEFESMEVRQENKRRKNTHNESSESMEEENLQATDPANVPDITQDESQSPKNQKEQSEGQQQQPKNPEKDEKLSAGNMPATATEDSPKEEPEPAMTAEQSKKEAEKAQPMGKWSKNAEHYMEFCDSILQKANEAKLEQKKQLIASGKKHKPKRAVSEAVLKSVDNQTTVATACSSAAPKPMPPKKDVKRLQAARHAVSHAVNLLAPKLAASKEPRSLVRKLSPQPPMEAKKKAKSIKKQKKTTALPKPLLVSPVKSSDEENHHKSADVNRIKTTAGYVTVTMDDAPEPRIELVKTRSGIMRVEPATPKQKYFREEPDSPPHPKFRVQRVPAGSHKKSKHQQHQQHQQQLKEGGKVATTQNPAMLSALRFKEQVFARK
ncbi:protein slender lobes [Drosophila obscura]|uniref:protein slender lobes n=1 Tax=Drosophila obscura TaxID=7282 RepID=UPI001BB2C6E5|nr:protein slender lobes [Drosophila obscura]